MTNTNAQTNKTNEYASIKWAGGGLAIGTWTPLQNAVFLCEVEWECPL